MRNSIRNRLTVAFIGVAFIPLLLVGVVLAGLSFFVQREQALSRERTVAISTGGQVDDFFLRLENELKVVVKDLVGAKTSEYENILSRLPSYPDVIQEAILIDSKGDEQAHLSRLGIITAAEKKNWAASEAFTAPTSSGQTYYSPVVVDQTTGEPYIQVGTPLFEPATGESNGVLLVSVRFKPVWDLIASIPVDPGETIYIVDQQNRVIAHLNPSVTLKDTKVTLPAIDPSTGIYAGITPGLTPSQYPQLTNGNAVLGIRLIQRGIQKFNVVAERDLLAALSLATQTVGITIALFVVALLLASVMGRYVAGQITRPIKTLADAAEVIRVGTENFDPRTLQSVMDRTDELGQLARIFKNMGSEVKIREQDLKQQVQLLKVEIDQAKKEKQVAEITETEMFKDLKAKAAAMRARSKAPPPLIPAEPEIVSEPPPDPVAQDTSSPASSDSSES